MTMMSPMPESELLAKGERLIPIDAVVPRGWQLLGELPTDEGPRLHIIYWCRQKRIDHQLDRNIERRVMNVAMTPTLRMRRNG